jgi:hypothetical protein
LRAHAKTDIDMDDSQIVSDFLGSSEPYIAVMFFLSAFNFIYLWLFNGIKKLDNLFSGSSVELDDSFNSCSERFNKYCLQYIKREVKLSGLFLNIWMLFNSISQIILLALMGLYFAYSIYSNVLSWING